MKINPGLMSILKCFATINTNFIINPGKTIAIRSTTKDVMAFYNGEDEFEKQASIFNLNELLGVLSAFSDPDVTFNDDHLIVSEGNQRVKFIYANPAMLTPPPPNNNFKIPNVVAKFNLPAASLARLYKMAGIISSPYVSFVGDGKKVIARVNDFENPSANVFDIEIDDTDKVFQVNYRVEKLKLVSGLDYEVTIGQQVSEFRCASPDIVFFIPLQYDSKV